MSLPSSSRQLVLISRALKLLLFLQATWGATGRPLVVVLKQVWAVGVLYPLWWAHGLLGPRQLSSGLSPPTPHQHLGSLPRSSYPMSLNSGKFRAPGPDTLTSVCLCTCLSAPPTPSPQPGLPTLLSLLLCVLPSKAVLLTYEPAWQRPPGEPPAAPLSFSRQVMALLGPIFCMAQSD